MTDPRKTNNRRDETPDVAKEGLAVAGGIGVIIGRVARLQVQRRSVKVDRGGQSVYTIEPIAAVAELEVSTDGCVGIDGDLVTLDVHHADHPESKSRNRKNGVSVGFTHHYLLMANAVGREVAVGAAGENVIVEADHRVVLDDLVGGMCFVAANGDLRGVLDEPEIITPCRTFSRFILGEGEPSPPALKGVLQMLNGGTRGFFGRAVGVFRICPGDLLVALPRSQ